MTLEQQIKGAERELALRRRVYGRRVQRGLMTESAAKYEIDVMAAIVETLRSVEQCRIRELGL